MVILIYILFLLVIMNFYLKFRKRDAITSTQRFMLSFMGIALLFIFYSVIAKLLDMYNISMNMQSLTPTMLWAFTITMSILLPLLATELVMFLYSLIIIRRKGT